MVSFDAQFLIGECMMNVLGLIVEYNPFHNGHLYHLKESLRITGADHTVCVMSGNFIQRGEPAVVNKWARTRMALSSGADLVIELPVVYSMASAEYFAFGAVRLLDSLGIVNSLCFGSESGDIKSLAGMADLFTSESESFRSKLREYLDTGMSFASAREMAARAHMDTTDSTLPDAGELIGQSNNILGIEYLKALSRLKSKIQPFTVRRIGNSYNMDGLTGSISSATAIRKSINAPLRYFHSSELSSALPESACTVLREESEAGRCPVISDNFGIVILNSLRRMTREQISTLPFVGEGLENRIKRAAGASGTLDQLIASVCTKRYTRTRIQRILFNTLTGMNADEFNKFNSFGGPCYIRVLGFNKKGSQLLTEIKKSATLPVIMKTADYKNSSIPLISRMLEIEATATDAYVLGYNNPEFRYSGQDFTQNVVRML